MRATKEMTVKRAKARYLIVVKGYSQKETADFVGVSEKTMAHWVKHFEWKKAMENEVEKKGGFNIIMDNFFVFVRNKNAALSVDLKSLWGQYCRAINEVI